MHHCRRILVLSLPLLTLLAPSAWAQEHDHASMHAAHSAGQPASGGLTAGGDAVFEAIAEVVALLEGDPGTDWSRVDLDALRSHLLDMNALFQRAAVETEPIPGGASFRVTGGADALAAARRMVPAHARALDSERGWTAAARLDGESVVLEVTGDDEAAARRIRGLGFFGLMAAGDHHRPHHLAIARGESPHGGHEGHGANGAAP
ncbi:MAG TPA: hypothetical protein VMT85_18615 [Thermoanaerobaculia bacterium]|nr:hypothetical protein [Thermoanaerobaculia bacterium]